MLRLPSDWTFFGLTFDYNQRVYEQIFDIVFYGQGGFTYNDVYNMPVNLRAFYYTKLYDIVKQREEEAKANQNSSGKSYRK